MYRKSAGKKWIVCTKNQQLLVNHDQGFISDRFSPIFVVSLIVIVGGGVQLGPLGTVATNRPIVPAPGDFDDGEIGGMMIGRGNRSTQRKPSPVPLCPPQNPHAARTRTRAAAAGSQRLTAFAAARPLYS
jgi:hypothetical protein